MCLHVVKKRVLSSATIYYTSILTEGMIILLLDWLDPGIFCCMVFYQNREREREKERQREKEGERAEEIEREVGERYRDTEREIQRDRERERQMERKREI